MRLALGGEGSANGHRSNRPSLLSRLLGVRGRAPREAELADELQRLERDLEEDPESASLHRRAGIAAGRLGHHRVASEYLLRAVHLDPEDAEAWGNLGIALRQLGDPFAASCHFAKALELNPRDRHARSGRQAALKRMDDLQRTIRH